MPDHHDNYRAIHYSSENISAIILISGNIIGGNPPKKLFLGASHFLAINYCRYIGDALHLLDAG
ncbi:unnamed protein product, partial [Nesidiocoris tenuis]